MAQSYALRFISGKYQGGEFPLVPEREIVIGRASDLDMVLVEDMVSRKHAKLSTIGGQVTIQDLGSTNGTFVNGEKVKKSRLKEGDRVLIGTSIIKVISKDAPAGDQAAAKQNLERVAQAHKPDSRSAMTGSLEEVPVPDLLTLFSTSKRTGVLLIQAPTGLGRIYLREGGVFMAKIDNAPEVGPMKAFCRIVGWTKGGFEFTRPEDANVTFPQEIGEPTEHLLMEAVRQLDEFGRIKARFPVGRAHLIIPSPLAPPLSALKPAELDVFQHVLNHGVVDRVLDASPLTDFDTASAVLTLIDQGYVSVR
ncbi:MAG: DUF4388 domain-containing protein [Deltaproteobacteria bacterium]|nr:DUF4388 domain-containing protein [Deltaproteobacteria bacterium]